MIKAFILLTVNVGYTQTVLDEIKKLKHLESVAVVTGQVDIVITVKVESLDDLYDISFVKLSNIKGIEHVTTHVVEKEILTEAD